MTVLADFSQTVLGHTFSEPALLEGALTHPSLNGGRGQEKIVTMYERLEFVGDRVLSLIISEWLYERHADAEEGELAKRHTALVNRDTLAGIAEALRLNDHLRVAKSEWQPNATIMADALEALIGAMYLDGGIEAAKQFVQRHWAEKMRHPDEAAPTDPKSALQEWLQARGHPLPVYKVLQSTGPAHSPVFVMEASAGKLGAAQGEGSSKREAEKKAATDLLAKLIKT